jgi:hypothetical protein
MPYFAAFTDAPVDTQDRPRTYRLGWVILICCCHFGCLRLSACVDVVAQPMRFKATITKRERNKVLMVSSSSLA